MTTEQTYCTTIRLKNKVHSESSDVLCHLVDLHFDGMPALTYSMPRINHLLRESNSTRIQVADFINGNIMIATLYPLLNKFRSHATRQIFEDTSPEVETDEVEQRAIDWLLDLAHGTTQGEEADAL